MARTFWTIVCCFALALGSHCYAISPSGQHNKWLNLPVNRLVEMAAADQADGNRTLPMAPGIYIVAVGKQAYKISVR